MTSAAAERESPHRILALDTTLFANSDPAGWRRMSDRIEAVRGATVLVLIGDREIPAFPDPDYAIDRAGTAIARMPSGESVEEWPGPEGRTGIAESLGHLAAGLLIPLSEVYCILRPDLAEQTDLERLIVIEGAEPVHAVEAEIADEDTVIDALEEAQFFRHARAPSSDLVEAAWEAAIETLHRNVASIGFTAASVSDNPLSTYDANYAAVWARDGVITGLWTLCLDDERLIDAFRNTIRVLSRHQAPTGQIPSNVRLADETPDYSGIGGIASIDSVIWFVIGAVRLAFHTGDRDFAEEMVDAVDRAMGWLAAHDSNNDALLEIPESSDWMDIFPRSYNVLYDEVLWWQACLDTAALHEGLGRDGSPWRDHAMRIRAAILHQFWPTGDQLMEIAGTQSGRFSPGEAYYLLSQITPFDYGWRCDVYANLLAGLAGLLDERKLDRLFTFLWGVGVNSPFPVRCLYPPISSGADDWKDYFLVNFLNIPDHYHNGGIWPFIGGLWVRFLVAIGRVELAHRELAGLAEACRHGLSGEWEFNEWLHGSTGRPMGKAHQAWSAASYVHAYASLRGDADPKVFPALDVEALQAKRK